MFVQHCNRAPVIWHTVEASTFGSEFQAMKNAVELIESVEASTFGSEFQAMKNSVELIESLRYKLRMFGVPIEGPTNVFCDIDVVCNNTKLPESTLEKKHHSIAYHQCCEAVAAGTIQVAKQDTKKNLTDLFTKLLAQAWRYWTSSRINGRYDI